MKRKVFDAGLTCDLTNYIIRMEVRVCDHITCDEQNYFHLQRSYNDNIDTTKYMFRMQFWERFGRFPKPSTFQLEQHGRHLRFTDPVASAKTLSKVDFIQTSD